MTRALEERLLLCTGETVDFENPDFKISAGAEWGIVECEAAVCLSVANVFIHPNGLSLPALDASKTINLHHFDLKITIGTKWRVVERLAAIRFAKP